MEEKSTPKQRLSIAEWDKNDRPRERLLAQGPKSVSDADLLAILIRSGSREQSAVDMARDILHRAGNDLNRLAACTPAELMRQKGLGEAKAVSIIAALELGMRRRQQTSAERPRIHSSRLAFEEFHPVMADLPHEEFWMLMLDRGLRIVEKRKVSSGGIHGTVADPKLIFRHALERSASCIVVAHNHPSGQLRPSEEDIRLTRKLVEGGRMLDILVQDHLIITADSYYSFADNGQLH